MGVVGEIYIYIYTYTERTREGREGWNEKNNFNIQKTTSS